MGMNPPLFKPCSRPPGEGGKMTRGWRSTELGCPGREGAGGGGTAARRSRRRRSVG